MNKTLLASSFVAAAMLAGCATAPKPNTSTNTTPVRIAKNTYTSDSKFGKVIYSLTRDASPGSPHVMLRCEESSTGTCVVVTREPGRGENVLKRLRAGEEMASSFALHEYVFCVQPLVADFPLQVVCMPKVAVFE